MISFKKIKCILHLRCNCGNFHRKNFVWEGTTQQVGMGGVPIFFSEIVHRTEFFRVLAACCLREGDHMGKLKSKGETAGGAIKVTPSIRT